MPSAQVVHTKDGTHVRDPEERSGSVDQVVAVFAPFGGVGTSTVSLALGRALALWRLPTTLVDLNLHAPDLAAMVGLAPNEAALETYLGEPSRAPLALDENSPLSLVPGLRDLENLDDVAVGNVVALLERLRPAIRVVDTAPVVTDPAVYAALRAASRLVLVAENRPAVRRQLARYRRLFLQLGLPWKDALLVVNTSRPGDLAAADWEDEVGLRPVCVLPYCAPSSSGEPVLEGAFRSGIEMLTATIIGA